MAPVPAPPPGPRALSELAQYLVAARMARLSFPPQWGAHPQASEPQADGAARARPTLGVPLTGLQGGRGGKGGRKGS